MFDSVHKIAQVIRKCKQDPERTKWAFAMMLDRVAEGHSTVAEMSNTSLLGTKEKKGTIDVILMLFDIKDHLLYTVLPGLFLDPIIVRALQMNYGSVHMYRSKVPSLIDGLIDAGGSAPQRGPADLSWMASWSLAKKALATTFEDILFKNVYERQVKQLVTNKQSASEFLTMTGIVEEWDALKQRLNDENGNPPPAAQADQPEDVPGGCAPEDDVLTYVPPDADEQAVAVIRKYQDHAQTLIEQSVTIIVETADEADLVKLFRQCFAGFTSDVAPLAVQGTSDRKYDVGIYDVKLAGESVTHPHLRIVGFRSEHYCKVTRAWLRAQLPEADDVLTKENLPEGPLLICYDGGKYFGQGPAKRFLSDRRWLWPLICNFTLISEGRGKGGLGTGGMLYLD